MKANMGTADRIIRLLLAAIFAALYFMGCIPEGAWAIIGWALSVVFVLTSLISFCPLYPLFGINTCKKK